MTFKDHFSGHAADYAAHRPTYPAALAEALAALCPSRRLAVEVGCGSGQLSTLLTACFDAVLATDASGEQIAHAHSHARLRYAVAPAEAIPAEDHTADLVVAAQAAHWFDLPKFHAEARRVLRPGGILALVSYGLFTVDPAVDAVVLDLYRALDPWWPPERRLVETGYADLDFPYVEKPFPTVAMTARWTASHALAYLRTWSAVKAAERVTGRDPVTAVEEPLTALWGSGERRVRWPLAGRLGSV